MPKQKDLKRLVRSRMKKTGESYTAARSHLLKKKTRTQTNAELAALAGMSEDAVRSRTGKSWKQWVRLLDAVDAASMSHRDIAKYVHETFDVTHWWAQTVTVGYERIRGLREIGQRRGGGFDVNKSKTFPVPLSKLYTSFSDARSRRRWLPGVKLSVRKETRGKTLRVTWPDGSPVEFYFVAKGPAKTQVTVQHRTLSTKADATAMKKYWGERLEALAAKVASRR